MKNRYLIFFLLFINLKMYGQDDSVLLLESCNYFPTYFTCFNDKEIKKEKTDQLEAILEENHTVIIFDRRFVNDTIIVYNQDDYKQIRRLDNISTIYNGLEKFLPAGGFIVDYSEVKDLILKIKKGNKCISFSLSKHYRVIKLNWLEPSAYNKNDGWSLAYTNELPWEPTLKERGYD